MVQAIGISILNKAVEFLFEEGKKVLEDIRTRRKKASDFKEKPEEKPELKPQVKPEPKPQDSNKVITTKDQALSQKIDVKIWSDSEREIEHLLTLLDISTKKYRLAEKQYMIGGEELAPYIILHRLENAEKEVEDTTIRLKDSLRRVYGKEIIT